MVQVTIKNTGKYYQFVQGLEKLIGSCCLLGATISCSERAGDKAEA